MINNDRIVPITAVDLLTMYGVILTIAGVNVTALEATTTNGQFEGFDESGTCICSEPVKSFGFVIGSTTGSVIYFVAAYDYVGFINSNGEVTTTGDAVIADGRTLYKATIGSGGSVTISKVGF